MDFGTHFTPLSKEEKEYVLKHYCELGETAKDVANWIGCHVGTVYRLASAHNRQKTHDWSSSDLEIVRSNYDGTKESVNRIGEIIGIEPRKVIAAINRYRI